MISWKWCPMIRRRRKLTAQFKQEAVMLVRRSGQRAKRVTKELGVSRLLVAHGQEIRQHHGAVRSEKQSG
jgi:transposase-like protein